MMFTGIQAYIFEKARIDNIFTDIYFERFTDTLNEVLENYEVRLNAQGNKYSALFTKIVYG